MVYPILKLYLILIINLLNIKQYKEKTDNPPNIFIYISDDQNQWDYGAYGNPEVSTTAADRLAKEGIKFNNAYTAQAVCSPSRSQLFTGLYPIKNGCMANHLPIKNVKEINDYLQPLGYDVVLAGKGHIYPNEKFNWSHFFGKEKTREIPLDKVEKYIENATKPFCIIFSSDYPHGPYPSDTPYLNMDLKYDPTIKGGKGRNSNFKSGYYQNIKNNNLQLEKTIKILSRQNVLDEGVFFYMSDHSLKGKWSVRETGLKIPLIVRWPKKIKKGTYTDQIVSVVDILPTIIDIIGGKVSDLDGKSFLPILNGKDKPIKEYVYGIATRQNIQKCYIFPSRSIRGKKFKYIKNFNSNEVVKNNLGNDNEINKFILRGSQAFKKIPYEELYDLEKDPFEHKNLAKVESFKKIKIKLEDKLHQWMIEQGDFLIKHKMPLIKPTFHPLDRISRFNKIDSSLEGILELEDYIPVHY